MSHRIELHDTVLDWEIDARDDVEANHPAVVALDKALRAWRRRTELSMIQFLPTAPLIFSYLCKHQDLREVTGTYDFTSDLSDPFITIACPAQWRVTELFRPDMTSAMIRAVQDVDMTSLNVEFT